MQNNKALKVVGGAFLICWMAAAHATTQITVDQQGSAVEWQVNVSGYTVESTDLSIGGPTQGQNGTTPSGCADDPFVCSYEVPGGTNPTFNTSGLVGGQYNWRLVVSPDTGAGSSQCGTESSIRDAQGGDQGQNSGGGGSTPEDLYLQCLRDAGLLPPADEVLTFSGSFLVTGSDLIVPDDTTPPVPGDNIPPTANCKDVTVVADAGSCTATANVNDGSSDPDGSIASLVQDPAGPYGLGTTNVVLTVTDDKGATDSCSAVVEVVDQQEPAVQCNTPATIVPPDAPISFTASGSDSCGAVTTTVTSYDCYKFTKKGKRVDKKDSCVVTLSGATATIGDSGGVGTFIEWTATTTDGSGNSSSALCKMEVANPGKGNK
jgi:hypothetical protein